MMISGSARKSSIDSNISEAISASPGPSRICPERKNSDTDSVISNTSLPSVSMISTCSNSSTTQQQQQEGASHFLEVPGIHPHSSHLGDNLSSLDPTESIYLKLRHFITLSDQTQEITDEIEETLRNFEKDNKEFLDLLELKESKASKTSSKVAKSRLKNNGTK